MLNKNNIPRHVAIIMDGNGRWARERGLPRIAGHRVGIKRVKEIIRVAAETGLEALTLFAFSSENWSRPQKEIAALMRYLDNFLDRQVSELDKNNIKLRVIGRLESLPLPIQLKINKAEEKTRDNTGLVLVLALSYGGRQEIVDAAKKIAVSFTKGEVSLDRLDSENFGAYLYTAGLPDPDLLIRTSGEMRLSNFLLWQLSYAELYFLKKYWPDFGKPDFKKAILAYGRRQRRFGGIDAHKKVN